MCLYYQPFKYKFKQQKAKNAPIPWILLFPAYLMLLALTQFYGWNKTNAVNTTNFLHKNSNYKNAINVWYPHHIYIQLKPHSCWTSCYRY